MGKKKSRLLLSICTLVICIGVMCFGVYSATKVEYTVAGTISYEVNDVFVDIKTSLYASTLSFYESKEKMARDLYDLDLYFNYNQNREYTLPDNIEKFDYDFQVSTLNQDITNATEVFESDSLPINYGNFSVSDQKAFTYYIVVEIKNYSENAINVYLDMSELYANETAFNTFAVALKTLDNIDGATSGTVSKFYVIALTLKDQTKSTSRTFSTPKFVINNGELPATDGFEFEYDAELDGYVVSGYTGEDTIVTVPSTHIGAQGEKDVVALGDYEFAFDYVTDLYIPDTITTIDYFFYGCDISSIYLPNSIISMEDSVQFGETFKMRNLRISPNITRLGLGIEGYLGYSIYVPKNAELEGSFYSSTSPSPNLIYIDVDEDNPFLASVDGVLFNKNMSSLLAYPTSKSDNQYTIPNSVVYIDRRVFGKFNINYSDWGYDVDFVPFAIETLTIPESVTQIIGNSFGHCDLLSSVYIQSQDVVDLLTSSDSTSLLSNITTGEKICIKTGLSITSYISSNFTNQGFSENYDNVEYDVYIRN